MKIELYYENYDYWQVKEKLLTMSTRNVIILNHLTLYVDN